jgi:hypothetical protein
MIEIYLNFNKYKSVLQIVCKSMFWTFLLKFISIEPNNNEMVQVVRILDSLNKWSEI